MIVIDASVLGPVLADDGPYGDGVRVRVRRARSITAPDLIDYEVLNLLRGQVRGGQLDRSRAEFAIEDLRRARIRRFPVTPRASRVWALRNNLTAYAAAYVALAEDLDCPLVTADARLAAAPGISCAVELFSAA